MERGKQLLLSQTRFQFGRSDRTIPSRTKNCRDTAVLIRESDRFHQVQTSKLPRRCVLGGGR